MTIETVYYQSLIVILSTAILTILINFILKKLAKISKKTKNKWDDAIIKSISKPLIILIWIIVAEIVSNSIYRKIYQQDLSIISTLASISITLISAWFFIRLINNFYSLKSLENVSASSVVEKDIIIEKVAKITIFAISTLIIVQILGFSISAILAAGGFSGLIIGFAAKDMFANLFGGLTIHLDKPFSIGDWIKCEEKSIEGIVEYIGWRHTAIRAFNANPVYVPNSIFTSAVVENPSRMTHRRMREYIGIRYCDLNKISSITKEIKELIKNHPMIDQEKTIIVSFDKFNLSSLDFLVYAFVKTNNWQIFSEVKQEILLMIANIIEQNKAQIAFPTQTIYLNQEKS